MYEDKFRAFARLFKYALVFSVILLVTGYSLSAFNERYAEPGRLQRSHATVAELALKVKVTSETITYAKKSTLALVADQRRSSQPMTSTTADALSRLVVMQAEAEAQLPQLAENLQFAEQSVATVARYESDRSLLNKVKVYALIGLIVSALGFGISYFVLKFVEGYRII